MSPPRPGDLRADALLHAFRATFPTAHVPVPVEEVAEDLLGLRVHAVTGLNLSGMIVPSRRAVYLNADEPLLRQRFTLAHEIGHWVVHCRQMPTAARILCRSMDVTGTHDPREREANTFAASLLMPADALHRAIALGQDASGLAQRFAVSAEAMSWRLYNLGLATRPEPRPPAADAAHETTPDRG